MEELQKKQVAVTAVVQKLLLAYIWQLLDFFRMKCRKVFAGRLHSSSSSSRISHYKHPPLKD